MGSRLLAVHSWPAHALNAWEGLLAASILSGATGLYVLSRRLQALQPPPPEGTYSAVQPFDETPVCSTWEPATPSREPATPSRASLVEPPVLEVVDRQRRPKDAWESVMEFMSCGGKLGCSRRGQTEFAAPHR
jgi:hypothetical protein